MTWDRPMMVIQESMLLLVPPLEAAAPPRDMAITAWAKSRATFCTGAHNDTNAMNMTMSTSSIVWKDGAPLAPIMTSLREGRFRVVAVGGTKVSRAKRNCTTEIMVGGSWRRMMRIAMTSQSGQALRIVVAVSNALFWWWSEAFAVAVLTSIVSCEPPMAVCPQVPFPAP